MLSPGRHVRTRLYFTSESHVHSLLSVFRYGGLLDVRIFLLPSAYELPVPEFFYSPPHSSFHCKLPPVSLSPHPFADALVLGPWPASSRVWQETKDAQWQRALAYLSAIPELNYMTQIVIMLYEDNTRVRC